MKRSVSSMFVCGALVAGFVASTASFAGPMEEKAKKSMAVLQSKLQKLGDAKIDGKEDVAGKSLPAIYFGKTKVNNNFTVVDEVKIEMGGTATVFVKDGEEFVRVSTNVMKDDGSRAIGTPLARNDAYKSIVAGKEFCGPVDILGNMFDTCYSPIKDKSGATIGIYYVGYRQK